MDVRFDFDPSLASGMKERPMGTNIIHETKKTKLLDPAKVSAYLLSWFMPMYVGSVGKKKGWYQLIILSEGEREKKKQD